MSQVDRSRENERIKFFFFFFQGKQSYGNIDDLSSHMDKLNTDRGR